MKIENETNTEDSSAKEFLTFLSLSKRDECRQPPRSCGERKLVVCERNL